MRIALLTTLWSRRHIEARVLAHHAIAAPPSWTLIATASPGDPDPVRMLDVPHRWVMRCAPNRPLGAKHNAGLRAARGDGCTHAVVLGSANFLSETYLASVEARIAEDVEHGGVVDALAVPRCDETGAVHWRSERHWPGYGQGWMRPTIIGTGRWFPLVDGGEWPPELESGLDAGLTARLVEAGVPRPRAYAMRDMGDVVLTRGQVQVTPNARYGA
jgi:hypothetical protein